MLSTYSALSCRRRPEQAADGCPRHEAAPSASDKAASTRYQQRADHQLATRALKVDDLGRWPATATVAICTHPPLAKSAPVRRPCSRNGEHRFQLRNEQSPPANLADDPAPPAAAHFARAHWVRLSITPGSPHTERLKAERTLIVTGVVPPRT